MLILNVFCGILEIDIIKKMGGEIWVKKVGFASCLNTVNCGSILFFTKNLTRAENFRMIYS